MKKIFTEEQVQEIRSDKKLSNRQLAKKHGVSSSTIDRIKQGKEYYIPSFNRKEYMREYDKNRWTNPEERAKMKSYDIIHKSDPTRRFSKAKSQAKIRKIDWVLSLEDFIKISAQDCYYCDEQMMSREGIGGSHLDRIDCNKGYSIDNIVSCCKICNSIRNEFLSQEETKSAIIAILKIRKNKNYGNIEISNQRYFY